MDSFSGTSGDPVTLANKLLRQCNSSQRVKNVEDIHSAILLDLYVGFLAETPLGLISIPITQEDEIHNCQVIIDHLATNLHTSLSHIRGRSIIEADPVVIQNLLEIISMLADIILNKIDSDISVDLDDTNTSGPFVPSNISDELSSREVRWDSPTARPVTKALPTYQTAELAKATHTVEGNGAVESEQKDSPPLLMTDLPNGRTSKLFEKSSDLLERANDLLKRSKDLSRAHLPIRDCSPPPAIKENTWVSPGRLDSTDDLVREGERIQQRLDTTGGPLYQPTLKTTGIDPTTRSSFMFDQLGVRPKMTQDRIVPDTSEETSRDKSSDFSASVPLPSRNQTPEKDRFRATVGPVDYTDKHKQSRLAPTAVSSNTAATTTITTTTSGSHPLTAKGLASSYTDLHSLVSETAAYVRAAVRSSPVRSKLDQDLMVDYPPRLTMPGPSEHRVPPTKSATEDIHLARDLNVGPSRIRPSDDLSSLDYNRTSPGAASRKVSFLDDRSYSSTDISRDKATKTIRAPEDVGTIRVDIQRKPRPLSSRTATLGHQSGEKYGSYGDLGYLSDTELENGKYDSKLRKRFHKIIDDVLAGDESKRSGVGRKSRPTNKQVRFQGGKQKTVVANAVTAPPKPKKKVRGVLQDTRHHLVKENKTQKKKTQILKKMYEEDLDDLSEEFREQMGRNKKEAKETENQFKKKVMTKPKGANVPKKSEVTIKVVPSKKVRMTKPTVSSKVRKRSTGSQVAKRAMSMTDDEDLMPVLLEEFPHLYLSEHTWHELWRRGINQIDQLTRTYAESKRKKSHAQIQVEEAERRHDILVNLVKKQLEHSKRLQDIKDQRSQQASVQNKLHEKRMQSARARKYYNEYQVRMRSKMLRRRTKEEMIFKKLFDECLSIQKERIQEVRRYAREQRLNHAEQRNNEIQSMENYYKDQFTMLAERVAKERADMEIREKAQQKMLGGMKKDLRRHMEKEIKDFQEQMFRDEDDAYFRQLDADRLRHGLQLAKFQTRV